MNNKINHLQERCLRIVCSDKTSSFAKLLETDRFVPIHIRNLQIVAAGPSKESKDLAPTIFSEIFSKWSVQYNLHHTSEFSVSNVKITFIVTQSLSYLGPKIWDLVPKELKELSSLSAFKKAIKKWKPQNCLCKISVLYDTFSDILDFFNIYVLVPKNFISFSIYLDILLNCFCL